MIASREHWDAIGRALGAFRHPNGDGSSAPTVLHEPTTGTLRPSVWDAAIALPEFLQQTDDAITFLEPRILVRGAITEVFAPRGLGKTQIAYAIALPLARAGLRVLLVDRDNPRHEVRRRLRSWGGSDAATFKVIGRDKAPALTDAAAWQAFPMET
jgi:Mrp family chromosome partitioning ATPase